MTKNITYLWREEDDLGSTEIGNVANFSVFDSDFILDPLEKVEVSQPVETLVDGEVLF